MRSSRRRRSGMSSSRFDMRERTSRSSHSLRAVRAFPRCEGPFPVRRSTPVMFVTEDRAAYGPVSKIRLRAFYKEALAAAVRAGL